jgi:predicted enzyme related to lactoylglutathione lyase
MFTKLCVDDLEKAARFYEAVCGLVELNRVSAELAGKPAEEIVYRPTYPGGPLLILAQFPGAEAPSTDELILGFAAKDMEAFLARAQEHGGRVVTPVRGEPGSGMRHAIVTDPEGHRIQVSEALG